MSLGMTVSRIARTTIASSSCSALAGDVSTDSVTMPPQISSASGHPRLEHTLQRAEPKIIMRLGGQLFRTVDEKSRDILGNRFGCTKPLRKQHDLGNECAVWAIIANERKSCFKLSGRFDRPA